jgi:hypothetical protein
MSQQLVHHYFKWADTVALVEIVDGETETYNVVIYCVWTQPAAVRADR